MTRMVEPGIRADAAGAGAPASPEPFEPPAAEPVRWSRHSLPVALAGVLSIVLIAAVLLVPLPYAILSPNQPTDTLGSVGPGKPLIVLGPGAPVAAHTTGALQLTTVRESGDSVSLVTAIRSWLDPVEAVVPLDVVRPPGSTSSQVRQQDAQQMAQSRDSATTAALSSLGLLAVTLKQPVGGAPVGTVVTAAVRHRAGTPDVRTPLASAATLGTVTAACRTGDTLDLVTQAGSDVAAGACPAAGKAGLLADKAPFSVTINLEQVGGPSAGLMFALGILDKLSPAGDLTGGAVVAGTGTITDTGEVGPIGGVQQKIYGARDLGHARYFLVPADNCSEARATGHTGITLVKVTSLQDALDALATIRGASSAPLPPC